MGYSPSIGNPTSSQSPEKSDDLCQRTRLGIWSVENMGRKTEEEMRQKRRERKEKNVLR